MGRRSAHADGILGGSYGFEVSDSFVTYPGWLYAWGAPLTLMGEDSEQIATARRELVRIGIDDVRGGTSEAIETLAGETPLRTYRVLDFAALAAEIERDDVTVLDVRRPDELEQGHVRARPQHRAGSS